MRPTARSHRDAPRAPPTWSENVTVNETARANLLAMMFHVRETLESSGTQAFKLMKYKEIRNF